MRFARQLLVTGFRSFSAQTTGSSSAGRSGAPSPASADPLANVKGLSANCVAPTSQPVGPGAKTDGEYKVPEYFLYNNMSYAEAEVEMAKFRVPQPSADRKWIEIVN